MKNKPKQARGYMCVACNLLDKKSDEASRYLAEQMNIVHDKYCTAPKAGGPCTCHNELGVWMMVCDEHSQQPPFQGFTTPMGRRA